MIFSSRRIYHIYHNALLLSTHNVACDKLLVPFCINRWCIECHFHRGLATIQTESQMVRAEYFFGKRLMSHKAAFAINSSTGDLHTLHSSSSPRAVLQLNYLRIKNSNHFRKIKLIWFKVLTTTLQRMSTRLLTIAISSSTVTTTTYPPSSLFDGILLEYNPNAFIVLSPIHIARRSRCTINIDQR